MSLSQLRTPLPGLVEQTQPLLAALDQAIAWLDGEIHQQVKQQAPGLLERPGIGPVTAGILLAETGDMDRVNQWLGRLLPYSIHRFPSEHHFASYCGAAPVHRGSGKVGRECVNPGGNRRINHALHLAVLTRIRLNQQGARDYFLRKQAEGKTSREALRLLKTYLAREVYRVLKAMAGGAT